MYPYVCEFGTRSPGVSRTEGTVGCQGCIAGYVFGGTGIAGVGTPCVEAMFPYMCANGVQVPTNSARTEGETGCISCDLGFALTGDAGPGTACGHAYTCDNGVRFPGVADAAGDIGCNSCNTDYILTGDGTPGPDVSCGFAYTCPDGDPLPGIASTLRGVGCNMCNSGYQLSDPTPAAGVSCEFSHTCENGVANTAAAPSFGAVSCQSCTTGFALVGPAGDADTTCMTDTDRDNIADVEDVDDDNDGLIEIATLAELNNVRYNLAGTSYDDEEADTGTGADTGDTTGAPTTEPDNCNDGDSMTTVTLCGYELTADLDFDLDNDGSTITGAGITGTDHAGGSSGNGGTLDPQDVTAYFTIDADGRGGWAPIGDGTTPFTAIFEGNNNTISNLSVILFEVEYGGLFGLVGTGGHIRNLGLIDAVVNGNARRGSQLPALRIGALVGEISGGTVTGCYATGSVFVSSTNANAAVGFNLGGTGGGLVGRLVGSTVIASHADVDVIGGEFGSRAIGGLVGIMITGTVNGVFTASNIIASYADGDILLHPALTTDQQPTGGLVGFLSNATGHRIIASYATGNITGPEATQTSSRVYVFGRLVGNLRNGAVSASYATGNITSEISGTGFSSGASNLIGGLTGSSGSGLNIASYATGDISVVTAAFSLGIGKVVGSSGSVRASYGFGSITSGVTETVHPLPAGVTAATQLTAANAPSCDDPAFTTQTTCESATLTLTPGVWTSADRTCAAPATGATDGVDYAAFTSSTTCTAAAKSAADVWTSWNSASNNTLNAWVFGTGVAPKLRYADYDGAGTLVDCDMFPALIPGTDTPLVCGPSGSELGGQE